MITIDASAASAGINFGTLLGFVSGKGSYSFYGGTPDAAFGRTFYMNGSQLLFSWGAEGQGILFEGEGLAYDYMHYGPAFGHGLSGKTDKVILGNWVEGETTGTQGIGAEGRISGFETQVTITGLGIDVAKATGNIPENPLQNLYNTLQGAETSAGVLQGLIEAGGQHVIGSGFADVYTGTRAADRVEGGAGNDVLAGGKGADTLEGGEGNDLLEGQMGADLLVGGAGRDTLRGGSGDDTLDGGDGADVLNGGNGNDVLTGGKGADVLRGGAGDDTLDGGAGADRLFGGAGADTFVFAAAGDSIPARYDTVMDFNAAEGDLLDVSGLGASVFVGTGAFSGTAGELRFEAVDAGILVQGDLDGNGRADFQVLLAGVETVSTDSFVF